MEENFEIENLNEESEGKRTYNKVDINQFYLNDKGELQYCELCNDCIYDCKVSFRVKSIVCPKHSKANKNNTYKTQRVKNKLTEKELAKQCKKLMKEYEFSGEYEWNFELYKESNIDYKFNEFYIQYYEKNDDEVLPYLAHKAINKVLYKRDI